MSYNWSEAGVRGRLSALTAASLAGVSGTHFPSLPSFALFPHTISIFKGNWHQTKAAAAVGIGLRSSGHLDLRPFAREQ